MCGVPFAVRGGFNDKSAKVLCTEYGWRAGSYHKGIYKAGSGQIDGKSREDMDILFRGVNCITGNEDSITDCTPNTNTGGCNHGHDTGVKCWSK